MRFLASSASSDARLRATKILGARQFVAGVVDHFIGFQLRRRIGTQLINLPRKHDNDEEQEGLQQERSKHSAVRENAVGGFPGEASARARQGGTD